MAIYNLIDYFDVWGNEEDGWEVQNQCLEKTQLMLPPNATDDYILNMLVEVGYLVGADVARLEDSGEMIEIFAVKNGMPLGKLIRKEQKTT